MTITSISGVRRAALGVGCALGIALTSGCASAPSPAVAPGAAPRSIPALRTAIESLTAQYPSAFVGVAYHDLGTGDTLYIDADSLVHAASTMKIPVMMRLYAEADAGTLPLGRKLVVRNAFVSIVDGSPYTLSAGDDSDSSMYQRIGDSVTVRELMQHMITRSSNLATNTLIALAQPDSINAMMRRFGASRMQVLRGVEDLKAFDKGMNNMATARDLATLLAAIESGRAASPASTTAMRNTLLAQEFNEKIPAGLPPGVKVAHKTGEITAGSHDAAIVYPPGRAPYILVVLTRGIQQDKVANSLIANISREVYAYVTPH